MLPVSVIEPTALLCVGYCTDRTVSEPAFTAPVVPSVTESWSTSFACTANSAAGSSIVMTAVAKPVFVRRPIAPPRLRYMRKLRWFASDRMPLSTSSVAFSKASSLPVRVASISSLSIFGTR